MSQLHFVKKAAKNYPDEGILKGQSYWWFNLPKPRSYGKRGARVRCAHQPRRSQYATFSEFIGTMMDCEDDMTNDPQGNIESVLERVRGLLEDCQSKLENIPENLKNGSTNELLEARVSACDTLIEQLEVAQQEMVDEATNEEIQAAADSIVWDYA